MAGSFKLTDTSVANLYKHKYAAISQNMYDGATPFLAVLNKSYDAVGDQVERPIPFGFNGGVGTGGLPLPNRAPYQKATFKNKKCYAVCEVDRQSIKQAKDEGAFVDALKESVKKTVEAANWNAERYSMADGTGCIGVTSSTSAVGGGVYDLTMDTSNTTYPYKIASFEVGQYVHLAWGDSSLFEITTITASTAVIRVTRISGSLVPSTTIAPVVIQGSENNDPEGLRGICDATSSSKYGINIGYRWQSYQKAATSAQISPDIINELILETDRVCGKAITHAIVDHTQMRRLLSLGEDLKRYNVTSTSISGKGEGVKNLDLGFKGVNITCVNGAVTLILSRFCESDRLYAVNMDLNEACHAPGWGWFDDEGFVFLRKEGGDAYEARYGGYMNNYFPPTVNAVVTGLATS